MSVQNFSFLARLEVAEKFVVVVVVVVGGWWLRPSSGFSFSQAEQYIVISNNKHIRATLCFPQLSKLLNALNWSA